MNNEFRIPCVCWQKEISYPSNWNIVICRLIASLSWLLTHGTARNEYPTSIWLSMHRFAKQIALRLPISSLGKSSSFRCAHICAFVIRKLKKHSVIRFNWRKRGSLWQLLHLQLHKNSFILLRTFSGAAVVVIVVKTGEESFVSFFLFSAFSSIEWREWSARNSFHEHDKRIYTLIKRHRLVPERELGKKDIGTEKKEEMK